MGLPWTNEKIKTNRTLISRLLFSLLSWRQKETSPGRLPQIKASCSPLAASPIRITTTKPAETIIYSFWCGFWSYPTSSTMSPPPFFLHSSSSSPSPCSSLCLLLPKKQGHSSFSIKEAALKRKKLQRRAFPFCFKPKICHCWKSFYMQLHCIMFYSNKTFIHVGRYLQRYVELSLDKWILMLKICICSEIWMGILLLEITYCKDSRVTGGCPVNPSTCNFFLSVNPVFACLCVLFQAWVWWVQKLCKGFFWGQ